MLEEPGRLHAGLITDVQRDKRHANVPERDVAVATAARECQSSGQKMLHVRRNRRLEGHLLAAHGMPELQLPGVQHLPRRNRIELLVERRLPIDPVADHRTAERSHVNPDLMSSSGFNAALY